MKQEKWFCDKCEKEVPKGNLNSIVCGMIKGPEIRYFGQHVIPFTTGQDWCNDCLSLVGIKIVDKEIVIPKPETPLEDALRELIRDEIQWSNR